MQIFRIAVITVYSNVCTHLNSGRAGSVGMQINILIRESGMPMQIYAN